METINLGVEMSNKVKLQDLIVDVFLLEDGEYSENLKKDDVPNWDSLGVVSVAVGVQEAFGYHMTPEEAMSLTGVSDIIKILEKNGISFE